MLFMQSSSKVPLPFFESPTFGFQHRVSGRTRDDGGDYRTRAVMPLLLSAFSLGFVAGLRTMTAPAVLRLLRDRNTAAYIAALAAVAEYAGDLHPNAPPRTRPSALAARVSSGAYCGRRLAASPDGALAGAVFGGAGAIVGAYVGLAVRRRAIDAIGPVPAALLEDVAAIVGAVLIVMRSR
jgi:uncharacterized membrane protein